MGRYCYKMTNRGLTCRGYQFKENEINVCDTATCQQNGFHAALNPLDCFSYYSSFQNNEFWLCYADGEVHENLTDSKISCTELTFVKRLELWEVVAHACVYLIEHPKQEVSERVSRDYGEANGNGFAIVIGEHPRAKCMSEGDVLALIRIDSEGHPLEYAILMEDAVRPGCIYDLYGNEVEDHGRTDED